MDNGSERCLHHRNARHIFAHPGLTIALTHARTSPPCCANSVMSLPAGMRAGTIRADNAVSRAAFRAPGPSASNAA